MSSRLTVWVALLATLFSAASPTFAAILLADRPDAVAQILGLPATSAPEHDVDDTAHHGHHGSSDTGGPSERAAHDIYCSFCLNPSSMATIAAAPIALPLLHIAFDIAPTVVQSQRFAVFHPLYRSRAPPGAA